MKKIMWSISFIMLIGTIIAIQFLPESVPMHYDAAGNLVSYRDKNGIYYDKDNNPIGDYEQYKKWLAGEEAGMAAVFTVMQGFFLLGEYKGAISGATKQVVDIGKITVISMGGLCIWLGNIMPKTRMNTMVGVQICWSMYNDTTWKKSNHFGGVAFVVAGVLTIITAFLMKSSLGSAMLLVGYVCVASIVTFAYAYKVYKAEVKGKELGCK